MRSTFKALDGTEQDFRLRYYQVQGAYHLLALKRMVLGDDTGLGKTLEAIAALAHMLERNPKAKIIILTPKSTVRQWAREIQRFTTGIRTIVIETAAAKGGRSPLDQRRALYREWLEASTAPNDERVVLITNYALLIRDWNAEGIQPVDAKGKPDPKRPVTPGVLDQVVLDVCKEDSKLVTIFDECFDYSTPVLLADGSLERIGKIVCNELHCEVVSWNWETRSMEAKPVLNWWRKPLTWNKRKLLKIRFRFGGTCCVTSNHDFYSVTGGKVTASRLKPGSRVAYLAKTAPSEDQLQIILGGLLGDASIKCPRNRLWGVTFIHGVKQSAYLQYKFEMLKSLGVSQRTAQRSGYTGRANLQRFSLHGNPYLCSQFSFHDGSRKRLSIEWLDAITPLGLAIWYGDDGSIQVDASGYSITLHTQGFRRSECDLLCAWLLWRWGVKARVGQTGKGLVLYLNYEASARFMSMLPGALPGVEYKFPGKRPLGPTNVEPQPRLIEDTVIASAPWSRSSSHTARPCKHYVYDLEVADNHNYFVGRGVLVSNCQAFANPKTKTWEISKFLSERSDRVYGLTATLLKNNLIEGFGIYKVIKPTLFRNKTRFITDFCLTQLQKVPGSARKIPIVVGYKNLEKFRECIDPFFLGRKKQDVSTELPVLISKDILCELTAAEDAKYSQALSGVLELGDGTVKDYEEHKTLVALNYCQQIVDSLSMIRFEEGSEIDGELDMETFDYKSIKVGSLGSKEQALVDLVADGGELEGERVIVFTRFSSLVPRLQKILDAKGIRSVAITGKQNERRRAAAQDAFQDLKSDVRVIFITTAGGVGINLQMARAMIFYDLPWTWGDYVQLLGRMIRIGSPHKGVVTYHLMAERPSTKSGKTIDHHVYALLRKKKELIDKVLGEAAVGALEFEKGESGAMEILRALQAEARAA